MTNTKETLNISNLELIKLLLTTKSDYKPRQLCPKNWSYSLQNRLYASMQLGENYGQLGTYKYWQSIGRVVKKGERAIMLCMPFGYKRKAKGGEGQEQGEKRELVALAVGFMFKRRWFSIHQTESMTGEIDTVQIELPEWSQELALKTLKVTIKNFSYNANLWHGVAYAIEGDNENKYIEINPLADKKDLILLHELAHTVIHTGQSDKFEDKERRELQAELSACLLAKELNILEATDLGRSQSYLNGYLTSARLKGIKLDDKFYRQIFKAVDTILRAGIPAEASEKVNISRLDTDQIPELLEVVDNLPPLDIPAPVEEEKPELNELEELKKQVEEGQPISLGDLSEAINKKGRKSKKLRTSLFN